MLTDLEEFENTKRVIKGRKSKGKQ